LEFDPHLPAGVTGRMEAGRARVLIGGTCAAILLCGCGSAPRREAQVEGSSSFSVSDGTAPAQANPLVGPVVDGKLGVSEYEWKNEFIVPARLSGIAPPPAYPASALRARAGLVIMAVRLTIGEDGRLRDIALNPLAFSTPTSHEAEFRSAIEAAVRSWKFRPAYIQRTERKEGRDGKMYRVPAPKEMIEWVIDVSFTFNADGSVFGGGEPAS
jgi:hypothetical protein